MAQDIESQSAPQASIIDSHDVDNNSQRQRELEPAPVPIPWIPVSPWKAFERAARSLGRIAGNIANGTIWLMVFVPPFAALGFIGYKVIKRLVPAQS